MPTTSVCVPFDPTHVAIGSDTMSTIDLVSTPDPGTASTSASGTVSSTGKKKEKPKLSLVSNNVNKMWAVVRYGEMHEGGAPPIFVSIMAAGKGPANNHTICGAIRNLKWDEGENAISAEAKLVECIHDHMPSAAPDPDAMELFAIVHNLITNTVTAYRLEKQLKPQKLMPGQCYAIGGKHGDARTRRNMLHLIPQTSVRGGFTAQKYEELKETHLPAAIEYSAKHHVATGGYCRIHLLEPHQVMSTLRPLKLTSDDMKAKGESFKLPGELSKEQMKEKVEWTAPN